MLTASPNSVPQKRDLHVGGVGAGSVSSLAAVTEPKLELAQAWLEGMRQAAKRAEQLVKSNPWAALAAVAAVGVAAGVLAARGRRY